MNQSKINNHIVRKTARGGFIVRRAVSALLTFCMIAGLIIMPPRLAKADDITGRLTYDYVLKGPGGADITDRTDYGFANGIYTLTVNWSLDNVSAAINNGDTMRLPIVFESPVDFYMSNKTFDFSGAVAGGTSGTAGTISLSGASTTLWYIDATFNNLLNGMNNISGTFTFSFRLTMQNSTGDQSVTVNGKGVSSGTNNPGTDNSWIPHEPFADDRMLKWGDDEFDVRDTIVWDGYINTQSQSKQNFLGTTAVTTIKIIDELGRDKSWRLFMALLAVTKRPRYQKTPRIFFTGAIVIHKRILWLSRWICAIYGSIIKTLSQIPLSGDTSILSY